MDDKQHKETLAERLKDRVKDAVGLPPGRFADGERKPSDLDAPHETLTSDDAEGLPPHGDLGTGLKTAE